MSIVDDVTDCVIEHYSIRFHRNDIRSDTDIKGRFNFSSAAWGGEAEALSDLPCIRGLGVRIPQSSMNASTTPESIARLVDGLVRRKRAASATIKPNAAPKKKKKKKKAKGASGKGG